MYIQATRFAIFFFSVTNYNNKMALLLTLPTLHKNGKTDFMEASYINRKHVAALAIKKPVSYVPYSRRLLNTVRRLICVKYFIFSIDVK